MKLSGEKKRISCARTLARIEELILEYEVEEIVLGLPKNMNDSEGGPGCGRPGNLQRSWREETALPVIFRDERLTTVAADRAMMEAGIRREHRKEHVDRIAAVLILQGYLDYRKNTQSDAKGTVPSAEKQSD